MPTFWGIGATAWKAGNEGKGVPLAAQVQQPPLPPPGPPPAPPQQPPNAAQPNQPEEIKFYPKGGPYYGFSNWSPHSIDGGQFLVPIHSKSDF